MGKMHSEGVTLIEALVTLAIVSVVLAVGVPALRDVVATNRMSAAANDIVTSLHVARAEAIKRAQWTGLCATDSWDSPAAACQNTNLADGWIVFADDNPTNGVRDGGEQILLANPPLREGVTLVGQNLVRFTDLGEPRLAVPGDVEFLLCDDRGNRASGGVTAGRKINMTPTGRPQLVAQPGEVVCP